MNLISPINIFNIPSLSSSGSSTEGTRKFFPHPDQLTVAMGEGENRRLYSVPIYQQPQTPIQYQDVGNDPRLQSQVTNFYHEKVLKWINEYPDFKHLKKDYDFLKSDKGKDYIYNMLRLFVKKSKANWFDLKDKINYHIIKKYLNQKIGNI